MIKTNFTNNYGFDPQRIFDFKPFLYKMSGITLYYGIGISVNDIKDDKNFKIKFDVETPNMLYLNMDTYEKEVKYFDMILHLCPYTCDYLNTKFNTNKFKNIFFPVINYDINILDKKIDILYVGHTFKQILFLEYVDKIIYEKIGNMYDLIKQELSIHNSNTAYKKFEYLANTKIYICHNVLTPLQYIPNSHTYFNDELCKKLLPWHNINKYYYLPQIKSRCFEGGLMGCILLVYKDEYKLIEKYFTENEDFIYFINEEDLRTKINTILNDYESYKYLGINARKKYFNIIH